MEYPLVATAHMDIAFRCRAVGDEAHAVDGEFQEARWHRIDALPELRAYDRNLLSQALKGTDESAFTFSGLGEVLDTEAGAATRPE